MTMGFLNWLSNRHAREVQADMKILYADMEAMQISINSLRDLVKSLNGKINRMKGIASSEENANPPSAASQPLPMSQAEQEFLQSTIEWQEMQRIKNFGGQG